MKKTTVHVIIGTRPEAIKTAPVYKALAAKEELTTRLISTGQHQELLRQALSAFSLEPFHDLQVMKHGQSLSQLTAKLLLGLDELFAREKPDVVLAHGDTTTCYAAAQSSFYHGIPFFHLEAGLRTFRLDSPFPEEFNRQCISKMASHHFATSDDAHKNLLEDGIRENDITVTGNTLFDAIQQMNLNSDDCFDHELNSRLSQFAKIALMTLHRRASGAGSLKPTMDALKLAAHNNPDTCFVFPVHPSPSVSGIAKDVFSSLPNVILCPPMQYPDFLNLMAKSSLILTDSGGVQEEAAYLGKNVLILRDATERCDGMNSGNTQVIGTDPAQICAKTNEALSSVSIQDCKKPSMAKSPSRIVADVVLERCSA